ncbi:MAG: DoxX family protein [Acidobacteriota bacterium]
MFIEKFSKEAYSLMRIVAGFLFFCHGAQKILGIFGGYREPGGTAELLSLRGAAGLLELIGGALIAIGLFTPWTAFILSGEMAFAYFISHFMRDGHFWPIQNRGESAVLYCFLFLFIASKGAGVWSIDHRLGRS